ncbi:MAG: diacylglycerol kinase family lipid kinase [Prevotellaceae bacterium]|jgi:YegS/Rv2252/BmrU family lipid kinase|nr:diacylglycerol kinase family lipid kinase [Prevotellaceae bacterium]
MSKRKIAFIVNPISGTKSKARVVSYIRTHPVLRNDNLQLYKTKCAGDATTAARKFAQEGYDIVVAIGGDGTVNEVAQGLMGTDTALGIIPMGSGNGLARDLGLPMNYEKAVDTLAIDKIITIDGGTINEQHFFCTSGIGYDALVGNCFANTKSRGLITYARISVAKFLRYKPQSYRLLMDGKELHVKAFLITIANASQWGNNVRIAPEADMNDGLFDVVIVSPFPLYAAPSLGFRIFRKAIHRSHYVRVIKTNHITIEREAEGFIHYDGEPGFSGKKLEFNILHNILRVVTKN